MFRCKNEWQGRILSCLESLVLIEESTHNDIMSILWGHTHNLSLFWAAWINSKNTHCLLFLFMSSQIAVSTHPLYIEPPISTLWMDEDLLCKGLLALWFTSVGNYFRLRARLLLQAVLGYIHSDYFRTVFVAISVY